jgi:predicted deacylase
MRQISGASDLGIPSLLPEMSGNGLWGNDSVGELTAGIDRIMKHLGMIDRSVKPARQATLSFVTMWVPTAAATGLWYSAVEVGVTVATGQALGKIRDPFGNVLANVTSDKPGTVVYRMTSLSVNAGEALLGVGTPLSDGR